MLLQHALFCNSNNIVLSVVTYAMMYSLCQTVFNTVFGIRVSCGVGLCDSIATGRVCQRTTLRSEKKSYTNEAVNG